MRATLIWLTLLTISSFSQTWNSKQVIKGSQDAVFSQDAVTHAMRCISYPHSEAHAGSMYSVSVLNADLDNGDTLSLAFTTPNTAKWFHMIVLCDNTSESRVEICEDATLTNGTADDTLVAMNHNRNKTNRISGALSIDGTPVAASVSLNATCSNAGTILQQEMIGSGRNRLAGDSRSVNEWILKQNSTHIIQLIGLANDGVANLIINWYEHTDKN